MSPKKKQEKHVDVVNENVMIANAGVTVETSIVDTLCQNYMPYVMSVIVSRALPEIDGFKPSHRRLLYTMYLMGLLTGARTKSANVVGQTMKLNPHGDGAIYETLVRLSVGNESLLHPYIDSKGNFGKSYSRDMAYAASRYTEVKLTDISSELFSDISKNTVDFADNYDNTLKEPTLFPTTFPAILVNSNIGIAVGVASAICPFNLAEVCETVVALLKNPQHDIASTLKAPDFPCGGFMVYDEAVLRDVYNTGRGSIKIRSKYVYIKEENRIEITEIPPTTTIEAIMDKTAELIKTNRVREIGDMRDETDRFGLRLTLDLKRGTDAEKLMQKLMKLTPLEDSFACNFTVLIDGAPRLMGVREILTEWLKFRRECVTRRTRYELKVKNERLHLLLGLSKILLDIDKAVKIVRETKQEKEVIPNLMIGFGIDEIQSNYIAEIKLRHLNREYILNRVGEKEQLEAEVAELQKILDDKRLVDKIIVLEQAEVAKKYVQPRRTKIIYDVYDEFIEVPEQIPDYPVTIFFTRGGYFKKITPQSLRMNAEQKLKEGDEVILSLECKNDDYLLFFTNDRQAYKCRVNDFSDCKASVIGDYVASQLDMPDGEIPIAAALTEKFAGNILFFYKNGKVGKVPFSAYETKQNRKKLQNAYSSKSELVSVFFSEEDREYAMISSTGRMLLVNSAFIPAKLAKDTVGVAAMTLKKDAYVDRVLLSEQMSLGNIHRFRTRTLPAAGALLKEEDTFEQMMLVP
ncbi:MAG: DNA topoisomerase (ATP-hydrolyzing) subunit A [Oscillospiraceae bacterium]